MKKIEQLEQQESELKAPEQNARSTASKVSLSPRVMVLFSAFLMVAIIGLVFLFKGPAQRGKQNNKTQNYTVTITSTSEADSISVPTTETNSNNISANQTQRAVSKKELKKDEWINLNVDGTEIRYRFEGLTPLQTKGNYATVFMMLGSIENKSQKDFDAYYFFNNNVKIIDAEGFVVPRSGYGWDYEDYTCHHQVGSGDKVRINQSYTFDRDVSDLTIYIWDAENEYVLKWN